MQTKAFEDKENVILIKNRQIVVCTLKPLQRTFRLPEQASSLTENSSKWSLGTILLACLDLYSDSQSGSGSADPFETGSNRDPKHSCEACFLSIFLEGTYPWLYQAYPSLSANKIPSMATSTHILWLGALTPLHDVLYMHTLPRGKTKYTTVWIMYMLLSYCLMFIAWKG